MIYDLASVFLNNHSGNLLVYIQEIMDSGDFVMFHIFFMMVKLEPEFGLIIVEVNSYKQKSKVRES